MTNENEQLQQALATEEFVLFAYPLGSVESTTPKDYSGPNDF